MFGNNDTIAMDIGNKYIKVMEGKKIKGIVQLNDFGICEVPEVTSNESQRDKIVDLLSVLFKSKNFKTKNVIFGIRGNDIIIRHVQVPFMKEKQMKQAAIFEVSQYLTMDTSQYIIDAKKISNIGEGEKKEMDVLIAAAPKGIISQYMYIADKLNLKLNSIDLFADSITRIFPHNEIDKSSTCIAAIDIGYMASYITLIENGKLFIEKAIDIGIKDIENLVIDAFDEQYDKNDDISQRVVKFNTSRKAYSGHDSRVYYVNNNARHLLDKMIDEIAKVFDFYISSSFNKKIDSIYLYGGGAGVKGIDKYIETNININTLLLDEKLNSLVNKSSEDLKNNINIYANCISLLLRDKLTIL